MTSISSSDTDEEDTSPSLYQAVPLSPHYTDVISDDSDEDDRLKSMYNVMTPLHVPGRHKLANLGQNISINRDGQGGNTDSSTAHDDDEQPHTDQDRDHISDGDDMLSSMCNVMTPTDVPGCHKQENLVQCVSISRDGQGDNTCSSTAHDGVQPDRDPDREHTSLIKDKIQEEKSISDLEFDLGANTALEKEDTTTKTNREQETKSGETIVCNQTSTPESRILDDAEAPSTTPLPSDGDHVSLIEDKTQEEQRKLDLKFDHEADSKQEQKSGESAVSDETSTTESRVLGDAEVPSTTTLLPDGDHVSPSDEKSTPESKTLGNAELLATTTLIPDNLKPDNSDDIKAQPIREDLLDGKNETTTMNLLNETDQKRSSRISEGEKEQSDNETVAVVESTEGNGENDENNSSDATDCRTDEQYGIDETMDIQKLESESDERNEQSKIHVSETSSMPPTFLITDAMMADLPVKGSISSSSEFCVIEKTPSLALIGNTTSEINTKSNDTDKMSDTEHDVADTEEDDDHEDDISFQKFENSFDSDALSAENEGCVESTTCNDNDGGRDGDLKADKIMSEKEEGEYQDSNDEYQSAEEGECIENTTDNQVDADDGGDDIKEDYKALEEKEDYQQENEEVFGDEDGQEFRTSFVDITGHRMNNLKAASETLNNSESNEENVKQMQSVDENISLQESNSSSIIVLSRDKSLYEFQSESSKVPSGEFTDTGSFPLSDNSHTSKIEDKEEGQSADEDKNGAESSLEMQDMGMQSNCSDEMKGSDAVFSSFSSSTSNANLSARQDQPDFAKNIVSNVPIDNKVSDDENGFQHTKQANREEKYTEENDDRNRQSKSSISAERPPIPPKSMQVLEHLASLKQSDIGLQSTVKGNTDKMLKEAEKGDRHNTFSISENASEHFDSQTKSSVETSSPKLPPRKQTSQFQSSPPTTQTPVSCHSSIHQPTSQTSFMQQQSNYPYTTQEQMNYMYFQSLSPEQQQQFLYMYCWQVASQGQPFIPAQQPAPSDIPSEERVNNQNTDNYEQSPRALWEPSPNIKATSGQTETKDSKTVGQGHRPGSHLNQGQQQLQENAKQHQARSPLKHNKSQSLEPNQKSIQGQDRKKTEVSKVDTAKRSVTPDKGTRSSKTKPTTSRRDFCGSPKPSPRETGKQAQDHPVPAPRKKRSQLEPKSNFPKQTGGRPKVTEDHTKSSEKVSVQKKDNFAGVKTKPKPVYEKKGKVSSEVEPRPEKCLLYITGMDSKTTSENLFNYLEGGQDDQIIHDPIKEQALIVFTEKPDMDRLYSKVLTKPIDGKHLKCQEIDPPTCIAVSFDAPISHADNLVYYFESKGNGGGAVKGQVTESEDGSCYFLEFEDPKVVERVCNRSEPHIFEKHVLRVTPYYTFEDKAIWDHRIHPVPEASPVQLKPSAEKFRFLKRCCLEPLKAQIVEKHGQLEVSSDGLKVTCTLTPRLQGFKTHIKAWHGEMDNLIQGFVKENIKESYLNLADEPEVWTRLLQDERLEDKESFNIHLDSNTSQIQLTGFEDEINRKKDEILRKVKTIQHDLKRTTKTKQFSEFKLGVFVAMGKFGELQEKFVDVKIENDNTAITVEGQKDDIQAVFLEIYEALLEISEDSKKHKYSKACVQFVKRNKRIMPKIQQAISDKNVIAIWDLQDTELKIACSDQLEPTEVASIIFSKIAETSVELDRDMKDVLETDDWANFCDNEVECCQDECHIQYDTTLVVYGYAESVSLVVQRMKTFFDENTVRKLDINMDAVNVQYIERFGDDKVKEIEQSNDSQNVAIRLRGQDSKVEIYGKKAGRLKAKTAVENYEKSLVSDKHKIEKIGIKQVYAVEVEKGTILRIEKETRCLIKSDIEGHAERFVPDSSDYDTISYDGNGGFEPAEEATEERDPVPESKDLKCKNGIVILQIEGEIGKQSADVLVASCSQNLDLKLGGASRSLLQQGGSGLQDELRKNRAEIQTGELVVLSGAQLECNSVFLTALPQWSSDTCLSLIQKFMTECLQRLAEMKKRSIIFSVLGTGQLKYPPNQVAQMMYHTVIDFDNSKPKSTVEEVKFIIYPTDLHIKQAFDEEVKSLKDGGGKRQVFAVQFKNVHVEMVIEDLAAQKVDAILCSTSGDFDLSKSGAAKALLKAGGKTLQANANAYRQSGLQIGQVGKISSGKLPCKAVFLTNLPSYSQENIKVLGDAIQAFLEVCKKEQYTSVAMPAMGTGFLKYPKPVVSRAMFEAVQKWADSTQTGSVKSVRFVMYAKDYDVIQAFKSQIKTRTGIAVKRDRAFTWHAPKKDSQQSQRYAMFDSGCLIGAMRLNVKVGDIVMENADAIVSSLGKPCEFLGAVAQSILKKCPKIEKACIDKKDKLLKNGILCTRTDRGLPSGHVIHVHFQESLKDWQNIVQKCLEKANKKGFRSLAFPVLGTGQGFTNFRPEDMAGCIFDAINNFFKNTPGKPKLKDIRLVIFTKQHATKQPIMEAIEKKTKSSKDSKGMLDRFKGFLSDAKDKLFGNTSNSAAAKAETVDSCITLTIHSDSKTNIEGCKKKLDETLDDNYTKKRIEDYADIVKSLSQDEMKDFEGTKHLVNIRIDQPNGIITIYGPNRTVSNAHSEALNKLRLLETNRRTVEQAKTLYTIVKWHHEDITASGTSLEAYDELSNLTIENAYKAGEKEVKLYADKEVYVINFKDMVEYLATDHTDQVRVVRKDIIKAGDANFPKTWVIMPDQENMKMVTLQQSDLEYKQIETTFVNGVKTGGYANRIPNVQNIIVTKIERIQNRTLYQQYIAKQKQMEIDKPNLPQQFQPMERILWHGTSADAVASIQRHGFNRSYCGKNGIWFGAGVYFANDPSYSARPWLAMGQQTPSNPPGQNKGYVFMCKVLTGQYLVGNKTMRYLPAIDPNKSKTLIYDSSVDNIQNPIEFVIYNDTQAYPDYIITFNV